MILFSAGKGGMMVGPGGVRRGSGINKLQIKSKQILNKLQIKNKQTLNKLQIKSKQTLNKLQIKSK